MNGLTPLRRSAGADYTSALADLTDRFRRAKGIKRRLLASQLIVEHEPLLLLLVDQLCGRTAPGAKPGRRMGGTDGFEDIERDDAMQSARIACMLALEQFNPAKGKWAPYLKLKMRHEMQRRALRETWRAKVPLGRESERPEVDLVEDWTAVRASSTPDIVEGADVTPDDLARWQTTGEWPESLEDWREQSRRNVTSPQKCDQPLPAPTLLERFLAGLLFAPSARVPNVTLLGRWRAVGGIDERPVRALLAERSVRRTAMRVPWSEPVVSAWRGVTIRRA